MHKTQTLNEVKEHKETLTKMRIEIFVVLTEIEQIQEPHFEHIAREQLRNAKEALIRLFGGITEIRGCFGAWQDEGGRIHSDKVDLWLFYTSKPESAFLKYPKAILASIKDATDQKSQAYTINNEIAFI